MKNQFLTEKISSIVNEQLPEFIQSDHPVFVEFLRVYYEWMEQNGNALEVVSHHVSKYNDVDHTTDDLMDHFANQFINDFPNTLESERSYIIKNIRDFYLAKGSEKAFRLLFKILFNESIQFYYPKTDILKASDGSYDIVKIMRVTALTGDPANLVSVRITQNNTGASAIVESVVSYTSQGKRFYTLTLNRQSIVGGFDLFNSITGTNPDISALNGVVTCNISPVFDSLVIQSAGANYKTGDVVTFVDAEDSSDSTGFIPTGSGAIAIVDTLVGGSIDSIAITAAGSGYTAGDAVFFVNSNTNGYGAVCRVDSVDSVGAITSVDLISGGQQYTTIPAVSVVQTVTISLDTEFANRDFIVGEIVIGSISGAKARVVFWDKVSNKLKLYRFTDDPFGLTDTLTSVKSGISAGITAISGSGAVLTPSSTTIGGISSLNIIDHGQEYSFPPSLIVVDTSNTITTPVSLYRTTGNPQTGTTKDIIFLDSTASSTDDVYTGATIKMNFPDSTVEYRDIIDYIGRDKKIIVNRAFTQIPDGSTTYTISGTKRSAIGTFKGKFTDNSGFLSSTKFLQDNEFYQDFSYQIKSKRLISEFQRVIKQQAHPVGMKLLNGILIIPELDPSAFDKDYETIGIKSEDVIVQDYRCYLLNSTTTMDSCPDGSPEPLKAHPNTFNTTGISTKHVSVSNIRFGSDKDSTTTTPSVTTNHFIVGETVDFRNPSTFERVGGAVVASWDGDSTLGLIDITGSVATGTIIHAKDSIRKADSNNGLTTGMAFNDIRIGDIATLTTKLFVNLPPHTI